MTALLSVLLLQTAATPQSSITVATSERSAIIRAVLAERAAAAAGGERTCLDPHTSAPLSSTRLIRDAGEQAERLPREQSAGPTRRPPSRHWYVFTPLTAGARARPAGEEQGWRLDAAYELAIHAAPGREGMIAAADDPAPLVLGARGEECDRLAVAEPAVEGDVAFVEVATNCGPLCGAGSIYALVRRNGRWRLEARMETWIS